MNFVEALAELKEGHELVRECWQMADGYLTFMPGMKHVWKILLYPNPNAGNHIFSVEEIDATDWARYDANKFAPKEEVKEPALDDIAA